MPNESNESESTIAPPPVNGEVEIPLDTSEPFNPSPDMTRLPEKHEELFEDRYPSFIPDLSQQQPQQPSGRTVYQDDDYKIEIVDDLVRSPQQEVNFTKDQPVKPNTFDPGEPVGKTGWYVAKEGSVPLMTPIIGKRKECRYFGIVVNARGDKVYMKVDGGATSQPRVIDFWAPIPDNLPAEEVIPETQKINEWIVTPAFILKHHNINDLINTKAYSTQTGEYEPIGAIKIVHNDRTNELEYDIHLKNKLVIRGIQEHEKCIHVQSKRFLKRKQLDILSVVFRTLTSD